jgi:hypothetical protein
MTRLRAAAVVGACVLAACTATETGNPVGEQRLALTARSTDQGVALGNDAASGRVRVDEAWVVLGDIRFVQSARCDSGPEQQAEIPGPRIVDLVAHPLPIEFAADATSYCRVRVPLDRAEGDEGAPAALDDHAILIRGERADGTPFELRSRQKREADIRARGEPFTLADGGDALILAFDVGRWLSGVDLDGADTDSDGVIRIDEDHERDRLDVFEENVEAAMELFRDGNGNGRLDDGEPDSPLARGGS